MNYPLTNQDKTDNIDVAYEEFLVKFKRLDFIENYHDAFLLVLSTIRTSNTNRKEDICALGIKMLETNIRKIWKWSLFKGYGELKLDYDYGFCSDWLIDRAIEAQFTKAKIQNKRVYIGRFPGYSWHSYYFANMGANYSLRYVPNLFAQKQDVDKMLNAIGIRLIAESMRCSMNQHGRKIRLYGGEYMVKVENASDPDEFSSTEIFLDRDQLIRQPLKERSNAYSKNEPAVAVSKDKNTRDDARGQKPSTASQISGIVESMANSKAEGKSKSHKNANQNPTRVKTARKELQGDLLNNIDKIYPMVAISGGTFFMGEGDDRHQVTLSPYQIGKFEVTQELWEAVMGDNHSAFKGARKPVTNVSWSYCQEFIKKLNQITGKDFRLPTEAEWEFAARGGVSEKSSEYSGSNNLAEVGWYDANSGKTTHNVGRKNSNKLGLYDMSGNINEWCLDWHGHYSADSIVDPIGPKEGYQRVARGGSWKSYESDCGVSKRYRACPYNSYDNYGMRLCVSSSFKGNYSGIIERKPKKAVVAPRRSYDIPNIIWRVILTAGLMVVMWAISEFIHPIAPVAATPAFVAIWNGSCDIF